MSLGLGIGVGMSGGGSPAAIPFETTLATYGTLKAYHDLTVAANVTLSGSNVVSVSDTSGNSNTLTAVAAPPYSATAINGHGGATLNGTSQYFTCDALGALLGTATQDVSFTMFLVHKWVAVSATKILWIAGENAASPDFHQIGSVSGNWRCFRRDTANNDKNNSTAVACSTATWHILTEQFYGTTERLMLDDAVLGAGNPFSMDNGVCTFSLYTIGANRSGASPTIDSFCNAAISIHALYVPALSDANKTSVYSLLAARMA